MRRVGTQVAGSMIALTAASSALRVSGLAMTCATPRAWAVVPPVGRPARNWAEMAIIGVPGYAARILSAAREPMCLGISMFMITRSASGGAGPHGVTALTR